MTEQRGDHWQFFNWPEILREAKLRLDQQREVNRARGEVEDLEKGRLEYWTAWCAHANAAACLEDVSSTS